MKPLPAAHIAETEDDELIWSLVFNFAPHEDIWDRLTVMSVNADRRDAALMLKLCHSSRVLGRPAARVWVIAVAILELEGHLPV